LARHRDNRGDRRVALATGNKTFSRTFEATVPGFGVSLSNLITDKTFYFLSVLEARSFDSIYRHLNELAHHFMPPEAWSILRQAAVLDIRLHVKKTALERLSNVETAGRGSAVSIPFAAPTP